MFNYSERTATSLASVLPKATRINTIRDFLELLNITRVERVQLESSSSYRSKILNDKGSQFIVYTDDGIRAYGQPPSVVKCAKFALSPKSLTGDAETRRIVNSVHRELLALTHQRLRNHPNIVRLLYYDLVEDGNKLAVPALIVERAKYGSLADFLQVDLQENISSNDEKRDICADVTSGLLALHRSEVVHGDVKTENVLIFDSSQPGRMFTAKLADFGSIIPIAPSQTEYGRYYGTKLTNAPEVGEQSMETALDALGLLKCDNYSLGLLFVNVVVGGLEEALTFKNLEVLDIALRCVSNSKIGLETENHNALSRVLELLLPWDPQKRTSDLALVLELLRPWTFSDTNLIREKADERLHNETGRSEEEVAKTIIQIFGQADYLNYISADVIWTEEDPQRLIFSELQIAAKSPVHQIAGNAKFRLAIAHAIGFGALVDVDKALELVVEAAKKGYLPAQAIFAAWHVTNGRSVPVPIETQLDWLYEATSWGSFYAGNSLRRLSQIDHESARTAFHRKGGYNQYFYGGDPPTHIGSAEFRHSLSRMTVSNEIETVNQLLQSAVIYGDELLTAHLLQQYSQDPNLTNQFGESLLVLACKGGHINVLKTLVDAGATAKSRNEKGCIIRESGLHWLTAFDEQHVEAALNLLDQAGAGQEQAPEISWNHPSIDLPGNFPSGCPLHFTAYLNNATCTEALVKYRPNHINSHGSDEVRESPLEYAIRLRRAMIAQIFVDHGALNDLEANETCLGGLGEMLSHEIWAINGVSQLEKSDLAEMCTRLVFNKAPSLLDMPESQGFTPIMTAAQYHSVDVVKALILFGCNVNAATPPENDARTALNLLTENHLHYHQNDLIEVLLQAGADFNHRSSKGGKLLIHFAARDNVVWILERCLDLGVSIDVTTPFGETPLHCAAFFGSYEVGRVLLERGANMEATHIKGTFNQRDWIGLTPIAVSATRLRHTFIEMLLSFGASPLARPRTGHTLLHLAVSEPETKMLEMLLQLPELRSNHVLELRDNMHGMTALHLAAGNVEKSRHVRLLLDAGADPAILTPGGWSVLDLACGIKDVLWTAISECVAHGESFTIPIYAPNNDGAVENPQPQPESRAYGLAVLQRDRFHESSLNGELDAWNELIVLLEARGLRRNESLSTEFPEDILSLD